MTSTVELPIWLLILILLFAAVTASTHLLFPSVRWFFRRRAERLVARLNEKLERPIQPFKLLRRQDMIQRVIYDAEVVRASGEYAQEKSLREDVGFEKAWDYAREIVPSFSATAYFAIAINLSRWLANKLFDVRLFHVDEAALSAIDRDATIVYVINHRSNFDYVLVTYLAARQSTLSYAVGEWARIWPLSYLIRSMGAYFIRRQLRTALYRQVLSTYVQKATEAGVTQAVFPEGGLSRNGAVGEPKLGILSYVAQGWHPDDRDVVFVPVSLNYDRVVEDRILVAAGRAGRQQFRASITEGLRFSLRYLYRRMTGKVGRFGVAAVTFGRPVSLSEIAVAAGDKMVPALAARLINDIRKAMPMTTTALALMALTRLGRPATASEIAHAMEDLRTEMSDVRADASVAFDDLEALTRALDIMVLRSIMSQNDGTYSIDDPELATYYVNTLSHGIAATAALDLPESTQSAE